MKKKQKEFGMAEVFCNIGFCLKFLYRVNKKQFFIRIPNTILSSISVFIPILFVRLILNEITVGKDIALVLFYVLGMVAVTLCVNLLSSYFAKLDSREFEKTMYEIKLILADYSMNM